jgi:hypothetical protein
MLGLSGFSWDRVAERVKAQRRQRLPEILLGHDATKLVEAESDAATADQRRQTIHAIAELESRQLQELKPLDAAIESAKRNRDAAQKNLQQAETALSEAQGNRFLAGNRFAIQKDQLHARLLQTAAPAIDIFLEELRDAEDATMRSTIAEWAEKTDQIWTRTSRPVFRVCSNVEEYQRRLAAIRAGRQTLEALRIEDYGDAAGLEQRLAEIQNEIEDMARIPATPCMEV